MAGKYKFKKPGGKPEGDKDKGESTTTDKPDFGGKSKAAGKAEKRYGKKEVRKGD